MSRMTKSALSLIALGAMAFAMPVAAQDGEGEPAMSKGEAELAKLLEGRVAGEPRSCVRTFANRSFRIIDDTALVMREGKTIWVNRTHNPKSLDDNDVLVIRKFTSGELCRHDNVTTADRHSWFFSGVVFLDDFVPYRLAEETGES